MEIDELLATPGTCKVGGVEYTLSPLVGTDWAKIKKRIVSQRASPEEVVAKLAPLAPPEVAKALFEKAYDDAININRVTSAQEDEWLKTLEGMQYQFFLSLVKSHPQTTEEKASELLEKMASEHLDKVIKALQTKYPEATAKQITETAIACEKDATSALIASVSGMPAVNPMTPAQTPETEVIP